MTADSAPPHVTLVALGDSTTAGTPGFRSPLEEPPDGGGEVESQYGFWLMQARPAWRVLNRGVNRERCHQIRDRFDRDVLPVRPALVIVIAGVNDIYAGRSAAAVRRGLRQIYDRAAAAGIKLVAGSILPYDTATPDQNARMGEVNAWIREVAAREPGCWFCDTRAAVAAPGDPDRLGSSPDGLHPDSAGYRRVAAALLPVVDAALG